MTYFLKLYIAAIDSNNMTECETNDLGKKLKSKFTFEAVNIEIMNITKVVVSPYAMRSLFFIACNFDSFLC